MLTAFLSRADVSRHLHALHLLGALRSAFQAGLVGGAAAKVELAGVRHVARFGALEGIPAWSLSTRSLSKTGARQIIQLHEAESGKLLAVMDGAHLSSLCAALVSALAADVLALPAARHVAVLGMGAAASSALKALRLVRSLEQVWLYEPNVADNFELARRLGTTLSMAVTAADSVREAVADADLVLLTGGVSLGDAALKPGAHVSIVGAEAFGIAPVSDRILGAARRFVDASQPALEWFGSPDGRVSDVLRGTTQGRIDAQSVTVFASVTPPELELAAAWHVFEGARSDEGLTRVDLET